MKRLFAEITDVNGTKHVADLSHLSDAPTTIYAAEKAIALLKWIKVQDGHVLNLDHAVLFRVKEVEVEDT